MIITLDGPCGSGKSTLAQLLAQELGFFYINSGYLYRSVAYILVTDFGYDHAQLHAPAIDHIRIVLDSDHFTYDYQHGIARVFFKNLEITQHLKSAVVSDHASVVASNYLVRKQVLAVQQRLSQAHNLVTDGRDCGTEIYPQAEFKFYIIADDSIRAHRLQADCAKLGTVINFDNALKMTHMRDVRDTHRLISPLKKAQDAIEIDTSNQSVQETLKFMLAIITSAR